MPYNKYIYYCFVGIMALLLWSCSNSTDSGKIFTPAGGHVDDWANIAFFDTGTFHGSEVLNASTRQSGTNGATLHTDLCTNCHGSDLDGGISRVSCFACHNGPDGQIRFPHHREEWLADPENSVRFHGRYAKDFPTSCAGFCHGDDLSGGIGPNCFLCHDASALADLLEEIAAASKPPQPSVPDFVAGFLPPPHKAQACESCHVTPDTFVENADIPNSACLACHDPSAPGASEGGSDTKVETHFSDQYIDPTTGLLMSLNCVECHNPMRIQTDFRGNTNLHFIRDQVRGTAVAFEAETGPYSFAYDLPDRPADMSTENYICNTCHTQTQHHQNDGVAPGGQSHFDGIVNCTLCHRHNNGLQPPP